MQENRHSLVHAGLQRCVLCECTVVEAVQRGLGCRDVVMDSLNECIKARVVLLWAKVPANYKSKFFSIKISGKCMQQMRLYSLLLILVEWIPEGHVRI